MSDMTDQEKIAQIRQENLHRSILGGYTRKIAFLLEQIDARDKILAVALSVGDPADGLFVYGSAEATLKARRLFLGGDIFTQALIALCEEREVEKEIMLSVPPYSSRKVMVRARYAGSAKPKEPPHD